MPWGIFILSRRLSVLLKACLLLGGLFWSVASGAQTIAQGGTLEVRIPDGGGEVQLVPLAGGPSKTCTQAGGADCQISGIAGDNVELTAVPQAGWGFLEWSVSGATGTTASPLVEPLPFGGVTTVDAYFGPILTVSVNGPGGGTVSSDDGAIVCVAGQVCSHTYSRSYTSPIQLTAIADSGSVFVGWNQPGGGNACANPTANVCELTAYGTGFGALPNGVTALFELIDDDGDGVGNAADQCPNTPTGESVDATGCAASQLDGDGDNVSDAVDQCPNTPRGESVNADGCSATELDGDNDGVSDAIDQCPTTPTGESVNADGCSATELDGDDDGVSDAVDQCPNTPMEEASDDVGCSLSQLDTDGDGVSDDVDQCPSTISGDEVTSTGCTAVEDELASFGDELTSLDGLSSSESQVATSIDDLCPRLILADSQLALTAEQKALREACSNLKNKDSTKEQQTGALAAITPEQVSNRTDIALDTGATQMRQISQRLLRVRSGNARGISLAGLTLKFDDQAVPGTVLDQAIDAVADEQSAFQDFGRWGVFVQGDVNVLDRDSTDSRASYESDSWLVTTGADYRFDNDWYLGVAVNYGETDTDYRDATSKIETLGLSLYGGWVFSEKGFIDFLLGYLDDDYDLTRRVAYTDSAGGFSANYGASTGGTQMTGGVNFGWMWNQGGWRFGPTASISFIDGKVNGYREAAVGADSAAWALSVEETAYSQWSLRLGAQLDYAWLTDIGVIIPGIIANYVAETARESDDTSARFAHDLANFGEAFTINRDFRDARYYDVTFNLAGQFSYGISAYGSYRVTGGRSGVTHSGYTLGLRWDQAF